MARVLASDELLIEADGPGATTSSVEAPEFLAFAAAYLQLLIRIGDENGEPVKLSGLKVREGSVALAVTSSAPSIIPFVVRDAQSLLSGGVEVPVGLRRYTKAVVDARARLPSEYVTSVVREERGTEVRVSILGPQPTQRRAVTHELAELRVVPVRAGGATAVARFEAAGERRPFTLNAPDWEVVRRIGATLQQPADIVAQIVRDEDGEIESGVLLSFEPVAAADSATAWREWYRANPGILDLSDLQ